MFNTLKLTCLALAASGIFLMQPVAVYAVSDEIQVYTDELNEPGKFGLEEHLNYSIESRADPEYPGQMPPNHVFQATTELSYGLTPTLEGGLYLPLAYTADGDTFLNGFRARIKYIAPHAEADSMFYGLNFELGRNSKRVARSLSELEIRPIIGFRASDWLFSFNPILNFKLVEGVSHEPRFEPCVKLSHRTSESMHVGLEYYGDYGRVNQLSNSIKNHMVFLVADWEYRGYDFNVGIGDGYANEDDHWVVKAIFGMPLN